MCCDSMGGDLSPRLLLSSSTGWYSSIWPQTEKETAFLPRNSGCCSLRWEQATQGVPSLGAAESGGHGPLGLSVTQGATNTQMASGDPLSRYSHPFKVRVGDSPFSLPVPTHPAWAELGLEHPWTVLPQLCCQYIFQSVTDSTTVLNSSPQGPFPGLFAKILINIRHN